MLPTLLEIGAVRISTFGFFIALSFIVSSFYLWKNLKDDYSEDDILSLTIIIFLFVILGARLLYIIENFNDFGFSLVKYFTWNQYPGFSFLGGFISGVIAVYYWVAKKKWNIWLVADKAIFAFFAVELLGLIGLIIGNGNYFSIIRLVFSFAVLMIVSRFSVHYRRFNWYKSGKIGFTSSAGFSLFFTGLALLESINGSGVYWLRFAYLLIGIISFIFLYKRSERNIKEDLRISFNRNKKTK